MRPSTRSNIKMVNRFEGVKRMKWQLGTCAELILSLSHQYQNQTTKTKFLLSISSNICHIGRMI